MPRALPLLVLLVLAGCKSEPPRDCNLALKQGLQCAERFPNMDEGQKLLRCFPFGKRERIAGTWVTGFETSDFYEGERASWSLITSNRTSNTQLSGINGFGSLPIPMDIDFVGRRSMCDIGGRVILVERVVSLKEPH